MWSMDMMLYASLSKMILFLVVSMFDRMLQYRVVKEISESSTRTPAENFSEPPSPLTVA